MQRGAVGAQGLAIGFLVEVVGQQVFGELIGALAGARVVAAAQHLHGGWGVDRDYPVHRFYLYAKQLELDLGGTTEQLRRIGRVLAEMPLDAPV